LIKTSIIKPKYKKHAIIAFVISCEILMNCYFCLSQKLWWSKCVWIWKWSTDI